MRNSIAAIAVALLLTACSQRDEGDQGTMDVAEERPVGSPDIGPSAAPGVAFSYAYDFRLADARIPAMQEAHAAACERLGLSRCRITGLKYNIGDDEQVTAMLQVKLDPTIARAFGKQSASAVATAGGRLINAEFTGEDEGSAIRSANSERREIETRIAEIEQRLKGLAAGDRERTALQSQLEELRSSRSGTTRVIAASEERLASTPMTFNYYGKGGVPGFRGANPIAEAWHTLVASAVAMISIVLQGLGAVLPWALLLLGIVMLVRSRVGAAVRRWWRRGDADQTEG